MGLGDRLTTLLYLRIPGSDVSQESLLLHGPFARKPKRIRTAFSPSQLLRLERAFEKNHYVVGAERKQLASSLSLSETQVGAICLVPSFHSQHICLLYGVPKEPAGLCPYTQRPSHTANEGTTSCQSETGSSATLADSSSIWGRSGIDMGASTSVDS